MSKNNIDKNFENLKAQMMRKKDMVKKQDDTPVVDKIDIQENIIENDTFEKQSSPKIIIKRQEKQDVPKRITYYLNNSTIKKIDKYSKAAGMGKSAFVQTLLDIALENLEIE